MKPCDKIKVLFILPSLSAGGAERALITLMNNVNRERFEPIFLCINTHGKIREWIAEDIPFYTFEKNTTKGSIFSLIKFIRQHKPKVIFTTMVHTNALALLMKFFFPKIRVVVREAALPSSIISEYGLRGRLCYWVYKLLYPFADLVISNCSQVVGQFKDLVKISTKNHRILFNPVDVARLHEKIPETFEMDKQKNKAVRFVCVGRLSYEKGYDRLIQALAYFGMGKEWHLDIVGAGSYRSVLEHMIADLGLEDRVSLLGYNPHPWCIAAQADCLLLPSRWEGMPNVVLEGLSCGIPAIATREAGGIVDIAAHSAAGDITLVDNMEEFVAAMKEVKPRHKKKLEDSILPDVFSLPHVMQQFEDILCKS